MPHFLDKANDILVNVYSFWPVQFERGEGVYLFDTDGKKYLDFGAGIAVNQLGYGHPVYVKSLQDQIAKLHMGLCYVADPVRVAAAEDLLASAEGDFDQVFFCSTGTEAVEAALKAARKWSLETKGSKAYEVVYARGSFHGRTMGALSVNGQNAYRNGFEPLLEGMHEAEFNHLESFVAKVNDNTSAIIVEPIQGEGGIVPATPDFLQGLRKLCDERDIALIFDEVQSGMGRTGSMYAYMQYSAKPDLIALAKGLGAGFPVAALMGARRFTEHLTPGSHGSTYGGNQLACTAVRSVLKELRKPGFLQDVLNNGAYLRDSLSKLGRETGAFDNVRGLGLMVAADYTGGDIKDLIKALLKNGLVALSCGRNALRLVPPLVIGRSHIDEAMEIIVASSE